MAEDKEGQIELELELEPIEAEKKDDDLVVEAAEEQKEPEVQVKQPELTVDDGINELKARLEEEKRAREAAERRAREAAEQAALAKNDAYDTNMRLFDNAIDTLKRNQEILKQNLRDAVATGDADAQTETMMQITKAENDLRLVMQGKKDYEAVGKQPVQPADPVEAIASQLEKNTPRSAEWVRKHPEYVRDPALNRRMIRAHEDAVDEGYAVDSDDYFNFVETKLKLRTPQIEETALSEAAKPTSSRSAPPAAPVSRSAPTNSGQKSNVVRLTAAEREHAAAFGMTDREYALQKQALIKSGKMVG